MLSRSAQKVQDALEPWGLSLEVIELPQSTRTAKEAAEAIGCEVGQIAKSLLFRTKETNRPLLVITSGANQVDLLKIQALCDAEVVLGDPAYVRDTTGFMIGGVPPIGHNHPIPTYIDCDLLEFKEIWAAAGTPRAVFRLTPTQLRRTTAGEVVQVAEM